MSRRIVGAVVVAAGVAAAAAAMWQYGRAREARESLLAELAPIALSNCELVRYGDANDGGYVLCGNLLRRAQAAYSYGINGTDEWGCRVSRELSVPVHQYDCFNTTVPACADGQPRFNAVCIGAEPRTIDGRVFDTLERQIAKNGDAGKTLVVKMDVEGSEWTALLNASDEVLARIDQLVVEFHGVEQPEFAATIRRLKERFYVANLHQNNFGCEPGLDPFPSSIFEVLLVNKRAAQQVSADAAPPRHTLDAPNAPWLPDCQTVTPQTASSEFALFRRWVRRVVREAVYGSAFAS